MTKLNSEVLGTLVQNEEIADWWHSAPIHIPLLDIELGITCVELDPSVDEQFLAEADLAIKNFLDLQAFDKLKMAPHIFANFVEICSYIEESAIPEKMKGAQPLSIWNFVHPSAIYVSRRQSNDKDIYIVLACECDWETEHGLQLVFRQGKKLTRVSDQDGHLTEADAFNLPDAEDVLLSAF
ncbi:MAG: hypothetical protein GQ574_24520 [Crocinitomix sp.]|nr:hypothetical protein [Crocinitomix sp.]